MGSSEALMSVSGSKDSDDDIATRPATAWSLTAYTTARRTFFNSVTFYNTTCISWAFL